MILKIVGAIWMIGPFIIFATSDDVTGELALAGVASFFMGLLAFTYKSKEERELKKPNLIPPQIIRKPKAKIETFVNDTILIHKDPVRYMTGSPGEVSRVLSENYYRLFCNGSKTPENALKFLEYRANSFDAIAGTDLNRDSLKTVSNKYYNKVSTLIFYLCYHENYFVENNIFTNDYVSEVYKIVIEEHNKMCPEGQEEINEFTIGLFSNIKEIYSKYNSVDNSSDEIASDDFALDFEEDVVDKETIDYLVGELEGLMTSEIEEFIHNNPPKGIPFEEVKLMNRMQVVKDKAKLKLTSNKIELRITDVEINYIVLKAYSRVYPKFIKL